jgi:hypothetical protein
VYVVSAQDIADVLLAFLKLGWVQEVYLHAVESQGSGCICCYSVCHARQGDCSGLQPRQLNFLRCDRLAYDGRGNAVVGSAGELEAAVRQLGGFGQGLYAEKWAPFVKVRTRACKLTICTYTIEAQAKAVGYVQWPGACAPETWSSSTFNGVP